MFYLFLTSGKSKTSYLKVKFLLIWISWKICLVGGTINFIVHHVTLLKVKIVLCNKSCSGEKKNLTYELKHRMCMCIDK